jgi:type II secretory pathway component PulF
MPIIVTPRGLSLRAELYHQLASLTEAGVTLTQALEQLGRKPPAAAQRSGLAQLKRSLEQGFTFGESLRRAGDDTPTFDIALLEAGEHSGRLVESFRLLAGYYRDRAQLIRDTLGQLAYPLFVAHVALLVFPIGFLTGLLTTGGGTAFVLQKLTVFGALYTVVIGSVYLCQSGHRESWRALLERVFAWVPLLGTARRNLALARLSAALEALISAGVGVVEAWPLAAGASGSPALHRAVERWRPRLEGGQTPADILAGERAFPEMFSNLYLAGEVSGKLDETLRRLHRHFHEEGTRKMASFAKWSAQAVQIGIMLAVAWQVISFYLGYFQQIDQVME